MRRRSRADFVGRAGERCRFDFVYASNRFKRNLRAARRMEFSGEADAVFVPWMRMEKTRTGERGEKRRSPLMKPTYSTSMNNRIGFVGLSLLSISFDAWSKFARAGDLAAAE